MIDWRGVEVEITETRFESKTDVEVGHSTLIGSPIQSFAVHGGKLTLLHFNVDVGHLEMRDGKLFFTLVSLRP
ncbi:MAG: hypothetical protein Q8R30_03255 [bacterium]|nr:hypothetical protein [bacterium]